MENRIKCGKCRSEYSPRIEILGKGTTGEHEEINYSCPVCGHGKLGESHYWRDKQILKDHKFIF